MIYNIKIIVYINIKICRKYNITFLLHTHRYLKDNIIYINLLFTILEVFITKYIIEYQTPLRQ